MFERKKSAGKIYFLPIDQIHPSPFQARRTFEEQELAGLAQSIRENGLLQPISVRKAAEGYELVAGERRLRACKLAQMTTIPAILCSYADEQTAALGLLENIQRTDLNPFEQAQGLRDILVLWDCTQAEAAKRLGMAQPHWPTSCACCSSRGTSASSCWTTTSPSVTRGPCCACRRTAAAKHSSTLPSGGSTPVRPIGTSNSCSTAPQKGGTASPWSGMCASL